MRVCAALFALLLAGCAAGASDVAEVSTELTERQIIERGSQALARAGIEEITWALTPYLIEDTMQARYQPILASVSQDLGVPITITIGDDYASVEEQVVTGAVDVAVLPPYTYVQGRAREPGLQAFASHISEGSPTYACYVIVRDDDPATQLSDLRGRTVAFVGQKSTSGWLVPAARLLQEGLHPQRDVHATFQGTHDAVFDAVVDGRADAGAIYAGGLTGARERRPEAHPVRVLAKGERMPNDAYVARPGFPPEAAAAIAASLGRISTATAEGRRRLGGASEINGFIAIDDTHYDIVRQIDAAVSAALR